MAFRGGKKLSKEDAEKAVSQGRGDLAEYEETFSSLEEGEGFTYEIDAGQKSITERSRWVAVAGRLGFALKFSTKKDRNTGESTITIKKGSPSTKEQAQQGKAKAK